MQGTEADAMEECCLLLTPYVLFNPEYSAMGDTFHNGLWPATSIINQKNA